MQRITVDLDDDIFLLVRRFRDKGKEKQTIGYNGTETQLVAAIIYAAMDDAKLKDMLFKAVGIIQVADIVPDIHKN